MPLSDGMESLRFDDLHQSRLADNKHNLSHAVTSSFVDE
jgi:hypothetical protein